MSVVVLLVGAVPPTQLAPVENVVPLLFQTIVAAVPGMHAQPATMMAHATALLIRVMDLTRAGLRNVTGTDDIEARNLPDWWMTSQASLWIKPA